MKDTGERQEGLACAWGRALVYLPGTGSPAEMVCQAVAPGSSFMARATEEQRAKSWRDIRQGRTWPCARSRKEWGRPRSPRPRARGGLLTHLGLQHLQSLGQLRHFAAVETTCGEGKAGAKARDPGPLRGLTLRGERYLTILIHGGAVWGWAAESPKNPLVFFLFEKPSEWNNSLSTGSGALGLVVSASKWPTPKPEAGNPIVSYWVEGYQLWGSTDHSRDATGLTGTAVWLSQSHTPASLAIGFFVFFFFFFS